jgi:hypothetical protein
MLGVSDPVTEYCAAAAIFLNLLVLLLGVSEGNYIT